MPAGRPERKIAPHLPTRETRHADLRDCRRRQGLQEVQDRNEDRARQAERKLGGQVPLLHRFEFDDKARPLLLVDFSDSLTKSLGSTISEGKCRLDEHDRITFDATKGEVDVDKVARLLSSIGISRAVARPDEPAPGESAKPTADKLDMTYGWREIRTWGDDAAKLVEKFDGLLGLYKGLPEIKPEAKELHLSGTERSRRRMSDLVQLKIYEHRQGPRQRARRR